MAARAVVAKLFTQHRLLTSAAYIAASICVCIFPSFDRRTEIEEHALIAGYAQPRFVGSWSQTLKSTIKQIESSSAVEPALDEAFAQAGLVMHRMNFTAPAGLRSSLFYTVASSRRGDSREANIVVLAANWTSGARAMSRISLNLAVGVTLAEYLKTVEWLSKDVIFVFVDGSLPYGAGVRAWLQAYFGGLSAVRRGVLRQAIVLQTPSKPTNLLIEAEGVNGMLPNQDIVNVFMLFARDKVGVPVDHREAWESVYHTFRNGGVHSSHAPFLEFHVPALTVRGQKRKGGGTPIEPEQIAKSFEGVVRSMSNALQQLHHSFNFYFFTGVRSHISNGLYLYPVFAMQLPLLSFLWTTPAFRDIRSFLVGLGAIVATVVASGSPIFFLGTSADLAAGIASLAPGVAGDAQVPECVLPRHDLEDALRRKRAVCVWMASGLAGAMSVALLLRRFAFALYTEEDTPKEASTSKEVQKGEQAAKQSKVNGGAAAAQSADGVSSLRLPSPLWDAVRCSAGFASLVMLAPITIYSWALAVPLTAVCVPVLILMRPWSAWRRPIRSLLLLAFLLVNVFLLAVPPEARRELLQGGPERATAEFYAFYGASVIPALPPQAHKYLPTPLVRWLSSGQLGGALDSDFLLGIYEVARDYNCVGGMLFPIFCFVYFPLLVLVVLVGVMLPAQRVEDQGLSLRELRLGAMVVLSLVAVGVVGGVFWRSQSSEGLGKLQW